MTRSRRQRRRLTLTPTQRLLLLASAVPILVLLGALVYMVGMAHLEGEPRTFWESLGWAGETLTTTGYGADARWSHPAMILFVTGLQFIGVFLVYLLFPFYLVPVLEERFQARLPREVPPMSQHLVVYRYGPAVSTLIEEAEAQRVPVLVLEENESVARRLHERGQPVLYGSLDSGVLERAGLDRARAVIANGSDDEDAAVILAARQLGFVGDVLALVEEPYHRKPMMLAGATAVYTPRHILGAALAARASTMISPRVSGVQRLGDRLEVREVRVEPDSALAGKTLGEADLGARTGATAIGQWVRGGLVTPPTASTRIAPNGILVVVGSEESLDRMVRLCGGALPLAQSGPFVICGYGEVGQKVVELLTDAGEPVQVIDQVEMEGVDLVGDVLDPRLLEKADVRSARAVILALDTDSSTLFATVILKDLAPRVPVIARVNQPANVERMHLAGADFALSISQVSGQMLAKKLLGEESVSVDPQLKVVRTTAPGLADQRVADLAIRERTRCSVVAVERGDQVRVDLGADFRFEEGDTVYVCGSNEAVRRFHEVFGEEPAPGSA